MTDRYHVVPLPISGPVLLWHPESPGMLVPVRRSWLGWLLKPRDFATLSEVMSYYDALALVNTPRRGV